MGLVETAALGPRGGGSALPLPALHWHNAGTSRNHGCLLLCLYCRCEGPPMGHFCSGVHPQRATGIWRHGPGKRQGAVPRGTAVSKATPAH